MITRTWHFLFFFRLIPGDANVFESPLEPPTRPPVKNLDNNTEMPYFGEPESQHVFTRIGTPGYLHCIIYNLGTYSVSWVRKHDLKILTVGRFTYTTDHRFSSLHAHGSKEWLLKISSPSREDAGEYDCQVSTEPKISRTFSLSVIDSRAVIAGPSEVHLKSGTSLNLTCSVGTDHGVSQRFEWLFNNMVLEYAARGGIMVETDQIQRTTTLVVAMATGDDEGNYTCRPSLSLPDSVVVHIINGQHTAAMQHGHSTLRCGATFLQWTVQLLLLTLLR